MSGPEMIAEIEKREDEDILTPQEEEHCDAIMNGIAEYYRRQRRGFIREPRNYSEATLREFREMQRLFWTRFVPLIVIAVCLVSIAGHLVELWRAL